MNADCPVVAKIAAIDRHVVDHHVFTFRPRQPMTIAAGQFVEVQLPGIGAFPVSICAYPADETVRACIRRAGRVTEALYRMGVGATVGLRGPFGRPFPVTEWRGCDVVLIAGGLGMAPLMALLENLIRTRTEYGSLTLLYGAKNTDELLFLPALQTAMRNANLSLWLSLDTPPEKDWRTVTSNWRVGQVASLLQPPDRPENTVAVVCGPPLLYGALLERIATIGLAPERIFATLERRMKCGVGLCCHCVAGGLFVCKEGPVFSLAQLRQMPGAI